MIVRNKVDIKLFQIFISPQTEILGCLNLSCNVRRFSGVKNFNIFKAVSLFHFVIWKNFQRCKRCKERCHFKENRRHFYDDAVIINS
jgi:hypothetical protein